MPEKKGNIKRISQSAILIGIGILLGIFANRNREYLINAQFIRDHWHFRKVLDDKATIVNSKNTMICLTFGQSNAANYADGSFSERPNIYNYYKGNLYPAKEPLLGPDGAGISVWTRVASLLIDSGIYDQVVIIPIAVGMTSINRWTEGDCRKKLDQTLESLRKDNINLTHIFWTQGETDNVDKTTKEEYKKSLFNLVNIFKARGIKAPFYSSITSFFPYNNENPFGISPEISGAQIESINENDSIYSGPNTDSLNLAYYRKDGVHFTEKGLDVLASKWYKSIIAHNNKYGDIGNP